MPAHLKVHVSVTAGAPAPAPNPVNTVTLTNMSKAAVTDYPLQFARPFVAGEIAPFPQVLIDGQAVPTQADVKKRYADGSVSHAVIAVVVPSLPPSVPVTLTFQDQPTGNNTALLTPELLAAFPDFDAGLRLEFSSGVNGSRSARAMLAAGDCKPWTSGPIARTIECGDDTADRKYDLGPGNGFSPFRPRFYLTFWPSLGKVQVRFVGENSLVTEATDLAYNLTLTAGKASPQTLYALDLTGKSASGKAHWWGTQWTKRFWLGGEPEQKINIDHNLAYLSATGYLPPYDPTKKPSEAALAWHYKQFTNTLNPDTGDWTGPARPNEPFDGQWNHGSPWQSSMGTVGGRWDIGPYPTWVMQHLYTGDWRFRRMSLTMADLAASWPSHIRETDPARRLNRGDPAGTGLGKPVSIIDRKTLTTYAYSQRLNEWGYTKPGDAVTVVGPIDKNQPWYLDGAHQPQAFFVDYVTSGDPYYLSEATFWAMNNVARYNFTRRGADGSYGAVSDELRGFGWVTRQIGETAFMLPDGAPEKRYLTERLIEVLAKVEGGLGITGTPLDGTLQKLFGKTDGNVWSENNGPNSSKPPLLHNLEANGYPGDPYVDDPTFVPYVVGSITSPWMQHFVQYSMGRLAELGFPAAAVRDYCGQWLIAFLRHPEARWIMGDYHLPVERAATRVDGFWTGGGYFTIDQVLGEAYSPAFRQTIPDNFKNNLFADEYAAFIGPGLVYLVRAGVTGAAEAWEIYRAIGYDRITDLSDAPKWAMVP